MGPPLITGGSFDILQDEACPRRQFPPAARADPRHALREIITLQERNFFLEPASASDTIKLAHQHQQQHHQQQHRIPRRSARHRRPPVECETFEPLDAVIEEPDQEISFVVEDQQPPRTLASLGQQNPKIPDQVAKHLAGQFEWLMMYPAPTAADHGHPGQRQKMVYGCNFLRRKPACDGSGSRDRYCFVASPLGDVPLDYACDRVASATAQPLQYHPPGQPIKAVDLVKMVENALSPPLVALSDDEEGAGSFFRGPASVSRIEDSFEELDKLEDELEAVKAAALPRPIPSPSDKAFTPSPTTPCKRRTSCTIGRGAQPETVRIKPSEKTKPAARRAASLSTRADLGNGTADKPVKAVAAAVTAATAPPTTPKTTAAATAAPKSLKPLTVPRFELPGDAVARRLREQRLARLAQQAGAQQKAQTCSPKPKAAAAAARRPLTKPTFELPGEAISRRKREEREAKLRAEEEEDRKKREFKARPVRLGNGGYATLPRAAATSTPAAATTTTTTASRMRRSQDETETADDKTEGPKLTAGAAAVGSKSLPGRVRRAASGSASRGRRKADEEAGKKRAEGARSGREQSGS
ncbi:hypothetical protein CP532_2544 [Ophiocordyceps camponoti-leonardi (nom. inval.)]|nr:hypothetical protein CP532_2544 [Ophiocordyceps camponoti-leonardi (nom. inval.)]